jgi:C-terminal processing protease CtpA/Prc
MDESAIQIVDEIAPGGPADKQGVLQLGDIIVRVNGKEVRGGQPDG